MLTAEQKNFFDLNGFLVAENAVDAGLLTQMREQFDQWVEESRGHSESYGQTLDHRARFDLASDHCQDRPALRRVSAPTDISEAYFKAMSASAMPKMVADLIGPNVKFHHSKINSKLPGNTTEVKWHQDFPYEPHSNTSLITALLMLDDVTESNGPLEILEGSHKGGIHELWHDGVFTGAIDPKFEESVKQQSHLCTGKAGSVCLMHTKLLHGSAPNRSNHSRTLFICCYVAGDSIALSPNPVPNKHDGLFVAGSDPQKVRCEDYEMRFPEYPKEASFFVQQEKAK